MTLTNDLDLVEFTMSFRLGVYPKRLNNRIQYLFGVHIHLSYADKCPAERQHFHTLCFVSSSIPGHFEQACTQTRKHLLGTLTTTTTATFASATAYTITSTTTSASTTTTATATLLFLPAFLLVGRIVGRSEVLPHRCVLV